MFRKLYNQAVLSAVLVPDGPLLVVQGGGALNPMAPDLAFVRTRRAGASTVYLPGSSLKGVLRAHAERILATVIGEPAAENPFEFQSPRREKAREAREDAGTPAIYRISCEADRLFGSTDMAGRFRIGDAYPTPETAAKANRTEIRWSVAIDRAKQSVQVGPFDQEAVTEGAFQLRATIENFELWMLSLVLQTFADLHAGFVQVGHAKSRGFGSIKVEEPSLVIRWPGARPDRLEGAGAREPSETVRSAYGLLADDAVPLPAGAKPEPAVGLFQGHRYEGWEGLNSVLSALAASPWETFRERARAEVAHGA
jgi:CRISPR/Cas system CSM-associated protein Csm3 (group 7 of RAMP superfamily)